jgi:hybrid cluster-associated redox disulfide protein
MNTKTSNLKLKTSKKYITENTLIAEVVEKYPGAAEVLTEDYGFHCISCFAAEMETIGMGAAVHGMSDGEIKKMLLSLNKLIDKTEK